ncbi:MAG: hypothetical protein ABSG55_08985 [Dehalococcoidia bacterium]|jgi:hypothetical protein
MADNIDPRLARERDRIKKARERLQKAEQREKQIAAEVELTKRRAEITQAVHGAVKQALGTLKLDLPPEGLTLFVHGENGSFGVDVKIGGGKSNGNGNRRSISALGVSGYVLPDGSKVDSAAAVLDHFKQPHKNDSAARLILGWAKDNPDDAATVKVVIGKTQVPLSEAINRI